MGFVMGMPEYNCFLRDCELPARTPPYSLQLTITYYHLLSLTITCYHLLSLTISYCHLLYIPGEIPDEDSKHCRTSDLDTIFISTNFEDKPAKFSEQVTHPTPTLVS